VLYGPQLPIDHFVAILRYQVPDSTLTQTSPYSGEYLHVEGKLLASLEWSSEPQFHFATGSQAETPYHLFSGSWYPIRNSSCDANFSTRALAIFIEVLSGAVDRHYGMLCVTVKTPGYPVPLVFTTVSTVKCDMPCYP